jgi:hypothetical protein
MTLECAKKIMTRASTALVATGLAIGGLHGLGQVKDTAMGGPGKLPVYDAVSIRPDTSSANGVRV